MTPHNEAAQGDYSDIVLLPGDPQRAEWMAETFLDAPRCVNRIRGCLGFTGAWRGKPVSIEATGMGHPSLAIYVHELLNRYGRGFSSAPEPAAGFRQRSGCAALCCRSRRAATAR